MENETKRIRSLVTHLPPIPPAICTERTCLKTEPYKETEDEAPLVRRAKALQKILEHMTIYIADWELIVGNQPSKPWSAPIFPEFSYDWIENELQTLTPDRPTVLILPTTGKRA
jgi:formate C-acetyltransferase